MYKYQLETEKILLENEKEVFNQLRNAYAQALADTKKMVKQLQSDVDILQKSNGDESVLNSRIYRLNYQKALEDQLTATMDLLNSKKTSNIYSFLTSMYEDGYLSINYHLQKQGIPLIMPINTSLMVKTINTPTDEMKFQKRLYKNTSKLKKQVKFEISRGIAIGKTYKEIAKQLEMYTEADFNRSYRIARTEGGRVSSNAKLDSMRYAKSKGADIVKQWDATLDGKTREAHAQLDQQIREVEEEFEINYEGHKAKALAPHGFGIPGLDINCRCVLLSVPRWDVQEVNEKYDAKYFDKTGELIKAKNYNDWKNKYYSFNKGDENKQ